MDETEHQWMYRQLINHCCEFKDLAEKYPTVMDSFVAVALGRWQRGASFDVCMSCVIVGWELVYRAATVRPEYLCAELAEQLTADAENIKTALDTFHARIAL